MDEEEDEREAEEGRDFGAVDERCDVEEEEEATWCETGIGINARERRGAAGRSLALAATNDDDEGEEVDDDDSVGGLETARTSVSAATEEAHSLITITTSDPASLGVLEALRRRICHGFTSCCIRRRAFCRAARACEIGADATVAAAADEDDDADGGGDVNANEDDETEEETARVVALPFDA